ncbi:MAG: hypothetical protein M1822_000221 [Bathelium mastoideum]|nr:MAG: hypothetical protein M1822_000221 [Bathelium mastoideum]
MDQQPSAPSRPRPNRSNSALAKLPLPYRTTSVPAASSNSTANSGLRKSHLPSLHHRPSGGAASQSNAVSSDRSREKDSELQQQQQQQEQQPHRRHHSHHHSHHHRTHRPRHSTTSIRRGAGESNVRDTGLSAGEPLQHSPSWTELLRHGGGGKEEARGAGLGRVGEEREENNGSSDGRGVRREQALAGRGLVRVQDVERERARGRRREDELRSTLQTLSTLSHAATRRLDTTHYALLDKLSLLRATIASLQDLATATDRLSTDFTTDTNRLHYDTRAKMAEWGPAAEAQQAQMRRLEERLEKSREVAEGLGRRVEEARGRVRRWEEGEREWQARTSRRLTMLCACLGALVVFFIALVAFQSLGSKRGDIAKAVRNTGVELGSDVEEVLSLLPSNMEDVKSRAQSLGSWRTPVDTCSAKQTPDWVEERMRVIDEL